MQCARDVIMQRLSSSLEYSSVWSRIMDLEERGRAKAGELCDVALERGLEHYLV